MIGEAMLSQFMNEADIMVPQADGMGFRHLSLIQAAPKLNPFFASESEPSRVRWDRACPTCSSETWGVAASQ